MATKIVMKGLSKTSLNFFFPIPLFSPHIRIFASAIVSDSAWKPKYLCGTDSCGLKMSSPTKLVKNRLPECVRPEKRLVRSFATNTRTTFVQIFFVPAPRFRLLNQGCQTRHVHKRCRSAHPFKMMLSPWKFLFGGGTDLHEWPTHFHKNHCFAWTTTTPPLKWQGFGMTRTMDLCNTGVGHTFVTRVCECG